MAKSKWLHARLDEDTKRKLVFLASRVSKSESDVIRILIQRARIDDLMRLEQIPLVQRVEAKE